MKKILAAIIAVLACSASAMADLAGTDMTVSVTHAGSFNAISALLNQNYTYGDSSTFAVPNWGSLTITSPESASAPGFDHAMKLDFTAFSYSAFQGFFATNGTITLTDIDEPFELSSVQVLVNGANIASAVGNSGNGFQASWSTTAVFNANPASPSILVAWNSSSVPGPGPLALLGVAGLVARRRPRRE